MSLTLAELLPLIGRLDDAPGFDTPRERFRRFLLERATSLPTMQALIDECQRSVGEQHHRVFQDLIAVLGRILQFAVMFGTYEGSPDDSTTYARWRSPGQLDVVLQIETDHASGGLELLARAIAASESTAEGEEPTIGLCVISRNSIARGRLAKLMSEGQFPGVRVASVQSLLSLASHVATSRVSHAEAVELLKSSASLDFMIDLIMRPAATNPPGEVAADDHSIDGVQPAFWVAIINGDASVTPERWLASVILDRHVLPVCHGDEVRGRGSLGDWVCFFLPSKGIVGHARLESIVDERTSVVRQGERFGRVYRLAQVAVYERPVVQALRAGRPFAVPSGVAPFAGSCLTPIARRDFMALTMLAPATEPHAT
jgi:hypothetical protein